MQLAKVSNELGGDTSMVMNMVQRLQSDPQGVGRDINALLGAYGSGQGRDVSVKSYAPVQRADGSWMIPTFNPNDQSASAVEIPDLVTMTPKEKADLEARTAASRTRQTGYEERAGAMLKDAGELARTAKQNQVLVREALLFSDYATQGIPGRVKMAFAQFVPEMDVTDEAGLMAAQTQLALNQLQFFKGPTTDFEMGVVQSQVGRPGDPRSANQAKLKALQRNNWFLDENLRQMKSWQKSGEDMDYYTFNFEKPVTVAGKQLTLPDGSPVTLMDLQHTAVEYNLSIEEAIKKIRGLGAN